jgi:hypothetical protein
MHIINRIKSVFTRASHTGVQHAENQRARNTDVTNIDRAQFLSFGASAIRPSFPVSKSSAPSDASCLTLDNPSCLMFDSTETETDTSGLKSKLSRSHLERSYVKLGRMSRPTGREEYMRYFMPEEK